MRCTVLAVRGVASLNQVGGTLLRGTILEWGNRRGEAKRADSRAGVLGEGAASLPP